MRLGAIPVVKGFSASAASPERSKFVNTCNCPVTHVDKSVVEA
jgi:hypothetical protein